MKNAASAVALVLIAAAVPAAAQEIPRAVEQASRADYERLCRHVFAGGGRIMRCLAEKQAEVSQPCKTAIGEAQAAGTLPRE